MLPEHSRYRYLQLLLTRPTDRPKPLSTAPVFHSHRHIHYYHVHNHAHAHVHAHAHSRSTSSPPPPIPARTHVHIVKRGLQTCLLHVASYCCGFHNHGLVKLIFRGSGAAGRDGCGLYPSPPPFQAGTNRRAGRIRMDDAH